MGLEARQTWWWFKTHAIPMARYLGRRSNGTGTLREGIEAENEGVKVPSTVRWLSGVPSVKARFIGGTIRASLVVLVVVDEDTFRLVCGESLPLKGRVYDNESYEKARADVECGRCSKWGRIETQCSRTVAGCGWCA